MYEAYDDKFLCPLQEQGLNYLFKRLCDQNQEWKFNALWKVLDDLTMKHAQAQAWEGSSSNPPPSQTLSSRPFTHRIHDASKEKWMFMYDIVGRRYGVITTNLAESYNMIMRGVRILPLVAIVKFILNGWTDYFMKRHDAARLAPLNQALVYGDWIIEDRGKINKATTQCQINEYNTHKVWGFL
jgi:hypothetical protein